MGSISSGEAKKRSKAGGKEMKKGPWTKEEDQKLLDYIRHHGHGSWRSLPANAGLERCGKSCRLRWTNYLSPDIKRGKLSPHEEKTIIRLHALLGNRWSAIAAHLPKRTDNEVKNYWNTRLKKRLTRMGIDPVTHRPKNNPPHPILTHMAQWEAARLEAEARLATARHPKLLPNRLVATTRRPQLAVLPCLDILKVWQANASQTNLFGSLESPSPATSSTLNNGRSVPTAGPVTANDAISVKEMQVDDPTGCNAYDLTGSVDVGTDDLYPWEGNNMGGGDSWDYWNEVLNLVGSSPLESPWMF